MIQFGYGGGRRAQSGRLKSSDRNDGAYHEQVVQVPSCRLTGSYPETAVEEVIEANRRGT